MQRPRRHQGRIELADCPCRQITRISKFWLSQGFLLFVKLRKVALQHHNLAANFCPPAQKLFKAWRLMQPQRYIFYSPYIVRHILADKAIAARHRLDQHAININQRARQAIHLDIGKKFMLMPRHQLISTLNPRFDFTLIKYVIQTNHPPLVTNFFKTFKQLVTNPLRWAIWRNPLWVRCFNAL